MKKSISISVSLPQLRVWFLLLTFSFTTLAWAAPDYVTNWPKQVPVETPDPVLGDKPFWEFWVYSEAFAKRFKGFPVEKVDKELSGRMQAMVLRIYKKNLWEGLNPNYPEQYACEWDVYFNDSFVIPLMQQPRRFVPSKYPPGVSASYGRLEPFDEKERLDILKSKSISANPISPPLIFADRPLDGRYSAFQLREYHPSLTPGLAVAIMGAQMPCQATAPKDKAGIHWLSLFGNRPYEQDARDSDLWSGMHGSWGGRVKTTNFNPGPNPESKGYFRVPETLNKAALPKVTLVKVLNWCINQRYARDTKPIHTKGMSDETWQAFDARCRATERHGVIDPTTYPGKAAMGNTGF